MAEKVPGLHAFRVDKGSHTNAAITGPAKHRLVRFQFSSIGIGSLEDPSGETV